MFNSGGWKIVVKENNTLIEVELNLKLAICDSSNDKGINLSALAHVIEKQMKHTYEISYTKNTYL